MKKNVLFIIAAAATFMLAACSKTIEQPLPEENLPAEDTQVTEWTYISADGGETDTKVTYGTQAEFKWDTGDQIAIYSGSEYHISNGLDSEYNHKQNATFAFSGAIDSGRSDFAIFPASLIFDGSTVRSSSAANHTASSLTLTLPASYNLSEVQNQLSPTPMIASNAPEGGLAFKSLTALLRITLESVPKQTKSIKFDFHGNKVQGEFTLTDVEPATTSIATSTTSGDDDVITVINDDVFSTFQSNLVVNIPVPTGVYTDITITTCDEGGHKINSLKRAIKSSANWEAGRLSSRKLTASLPVFAVSGSNAVGYGTKVVFAPGNLQAVLSVIPKSNQIIGKASHWMFAPNQYTAIGGTIANALNNDPNIEGRPAVGDVIDLFAYIGASATATGCDPNYTGYTYAEGEQYGILYPSYTNEPRADGTNWTQWVGTANPDVINTDWGHLVIYDEIGPYNPDDWRLLTKAECQKMLLNRGQTHYAKATLTSGGNPVAYGLIVFPDRYSHPARVNQSLNSTNTTSVDCSTNVFTLEQWAEMEAVGCAFLPLTNVRTKGSYSRTIHAGDGMYWLSNCESASNGLTIAFNSLPQGASSFSASSNAFQAGKSAAKQNGYAVRLVRVVN